MADQTHEVSGEPTAPNHESADEIQIHCIRSKGSTNSTKMQGIEKPTSANIFWDDTRQRFSIGPSAGHASAKKKETKEVATAAWEDYQKNISDIPENGDECQPITIFSLPHYICEINKAMYKPKLVSIGPYNYDGNNGPLRTQQEHKYWCARDFMDAHNMDPQECIRKMEANESKARMCYSEKTHFGSVDFVKMLFLNEKTHSGSVDFVKMLFLDGCFILEFIRKHHGDVLDSFFNIKRNRATILTDILLLENQIPYFIIHELFNLATGTSSCSESSCRLRDLIFVLLPPQIFWRKPQIPCDMIHHLLHFYYLCMVPNPCSEHRAIHSPSNKNTTASDKITMGSLDLAKAPKPKHYDADKSKPLVMPSVTELSEAGVRFRRKTQPRHIFDVTFENGVVEIPALFIDDLNCVLLANLLAFQQMSYGPNGIISHFVSLFDNLIDTEKDVSLLESSDVLINMIGSEEETASFFNQLGKWNLVEHSENYLKMMTEVQAFYNSPWPKYRATLMRDYFTNPWTIISVIAAFVLLGLTFVQTYYAVYTGIHN